METIHGSFDEPMMVGERCQISDGADLRTPCVIGRDSASATER